MPGNPRAAWGAEGRGRIRAAAFTNRGYPASVRMRRTVIVVAAAGVGIATSLGSVPVVQADTTPQVGDCYDYSNQEASQRITTAPKVDCATKHRGETFFVGTVGANFPPPRRVKPKAATREALRNCTSERMNAYLGLTNDFPTRFTITAHFPSQAEWDAGARWVRCDLTLRKGTGTETWAGTAPALIAGTPRDVFNFCAPGVGYLNWPDPRRKNAQQCTKPGKQWILVAQKLIGKADARYPGQRTVDRRAAAKCKPLRNTYAGGLPSARRGWFYIYPTAAGWARGERQAMCWVPLKQYLDTIAPPVPPTEPAPPGS